MADADLAVALHYDPERPERLRASGTHRRAGEAYRQTGKL